MLGELLHLIRSIEKRALSSPVASSLGALLQNVETRLGAPASGTVASQVGSDADASSATGSVHAKIKDLKANPSSVINSIQRGTITMTQSVLSATATITSVNTAKATTAHLGQVAVANDVSQGVARVELTNATTVTGTRGYGGTAGSFVVGYEVVEYK